MPCPVLANGNVYSSEHANEVLKITGAHGLMIGRGAIRNPWLFDQIRQRRAGVTPFVPSGRDVLEYVHALYAAVSSPGVTEWQQVHGMKKYLNFIGIGVEPAGRFIHEVRRTSTKADFFRICDEFLDHSAPMPLEPFPIVFKDADVMAGVHL
jgi:tRNA-dihydrouridine synthase B